jgi:hypothetical protein
VPAALDQEQLMGEQVAQGEDHIMAQEEEQVIREVQVALEVMRDHLVQVEY